jgi:hypothetical protein
MPSKPLAFGLLAAACIVAAAGGAYVAVRQNPAPIHHPAATTVTTAAPPSVVNQTPGPKPVVETDQVIAPRPLPAAVTPKPAPAEATARRRPAPPVNQPAAAPQPVEAQQQPPPPDPVSHDQGATPPPKPWPNSGGVADARGTPQPPITLPPPVESTPVREVQEAPPPAQAFEELVVPTDSVLGLQLQTTLSSARAQVEDPVDARVTRDVRVGDRIVIPAGTRALGSVVQVERGGKMRERAHLAIRFHTLVLADSSRLSISTDPIYREGESPANKSAAKIGGAAVGGAILGAIIGGGKGAAIGGALGAAGGTGAVMAGDRAAVTLPSGTLMTVRILAPVTVTIQK